MMGTRALVLALFAAMALVACDKSVNSGNANAPGSPGTGNAAQVTVPAAPDSPAAAGNSDAGGRMRNAHAGAGKAGGLGTGNSGLGMTGSFPAGTSSAAASVGR